MFSRNSGNKRGAKVLVGNRGSVARSFLSIFTISMKTVPKTKAEEEQPRHKVSESDCPAG